jgi:hypothetical protein
MGDSPRARFLYPPPFGIIPPLDKRFTEGNRIDKYTEQQDHAVVWTTLLPMLLATNRDQPTNQLL